MCANTLNSLASVKGRIIYIFFLFSLPVLPRHEVESENVTERFGVTIWNKAEHLKDVGDSHCWLASQWFSLGDWQSGGKENCQCRDSDESDERCGWEISFFIVPTN